MGCAATAPAMRTTYFHGGNLWKTQQTRGPSFSHAVIKGTDRGQLEIQIGSDSKVVHIREQIRIEHNLDVVLCWADGSPEFNDDVIIGDMLRSGQITAFECSVAALENHIGLWETPGQYRTRHLLWLGGVPAGDHRVLNTLWLLSIFGANMPEVSLEGNPPIVPDVSQASFSAITSLESLWGNVSHSSPQILCKTWQESKQSLMPYYSADAHKKLLKFVLHRKEPDNGCPHLRAALLHVGRVFHFGVGNFVANWKSGRYLMLLLIAQARMEAVGKC